MSKEKIREEVYEMVWAILAKKLKNHIRIEEDPDDDRLDDIDENVQYSKYYRTFSWRLWREGQELIINAHDNGDVSMVIKEQVHRTIVINLICENNPVDFLETTKNTLTDLIQIFYTGNWHIFADFLSPAPEGETDWRELVDLYKNYETEQPYVCGVNITYM